MTRKSQIGDYSPDEASRSKAQDYFRKKDRQDLISELDDIIEQFQAHHRAHGSKMACWPSAFQTWYCNSVKFTRKPQPQRLEPRKFREEQPSRRQSFKASDYDTVPATNLRPVGDILRDKLFRS